MEILGLTEHGWAALPAMQRARWLVFLPLKAEVQSYYEHEAALAKSDIDLEDWLGYDKDVRKMKLETALKAK